MPKFWVYESYRIEHEVEADSAEEALDKINEDNEYQYTVRISYDHIPGDPHWEYESGSTKIINQETLEVTE